VSARAIPIPVMIRSRGFGGLGQACSVWDVLDGSCAATDSYGLPCSVEDVLEGTCGETQAQGLTPYVCNWLEKLFDPTGCASAASAPTSPAAMSLPSGGAPNPVTIASSCPAGTSITDGTCIQSGTDVNGNPIYVAVPNAQQQQAQNVAAIQSVTAANTPVDCSQWYNNWFNPACDCTTCESALMWAGIGLAAFLGLKVLKVI